MPVGDRADQSNGKGLEKDGQGLLIDEMPWEWSWRKTGSKPCRKELARRRNGRHEGPEIGVQGGHQCAWELGEQEARKRGEAKAQMARHKDEPDIKMRDSTLS